MGDQQQTIVANLTTFGELQFSLWKDHRVGICLWRELIICRLGTKYGSSPSDFEQSFRESDMVDGSPDILVTGDIGPLAEWGNLMTGVDNPREDGPGNLNCDMDPDNTGVDMTLSGAVHRDTQTGDMDSGNVSDLTDSEDAMSRGALQLNDPLLNFHVEVPASKVDSLPFANPVHLANGEISPEPGVPGNEDVDNFRFGCPVGVYSNLYQRGVPGDELKARSPRLFNEEKLDQV